jgi:hypothetical protein
MLLVVGIAALIAATRVRAQSDAKPPAFEVVSIKPNRSGTSGWLLAPQPGGRVIAENVPLRALILAAYQLQGFQLLGAPSWLDADRFDVAAKAEGDPPANHCSQTDSSWRCTPKQGISRSTRWRS